MKGRRIQNIFIYGCVLLVGLLGAFGCGSPNSASEENVAEGAMELHYAENFTVEYYADGIKLLTTMDGTKICVIPEGVEAPDDLEKDTILIQQPVEDLYLVASAVMDMFDRLDAVDTIRLSGQASDGWYVQSARESMERGEMLYAGKYNKPDYELIVAEKCSLAIESTMINHTPEVKEMLEQFNVPVLVDYSSYESHPLGRMEWIKFYGALLGKDEEAQKEFEKQEEILDRVSAEEKTGMTVAFFNVTSNGLVQVRQSSDYIPKMIELAGGKYVFDDIGDAQSKRSTINLQVEEFYEGAKNADFIIYNSSIDGGLNDIDELLDKCSVLEDFQAVKNQNVWCTSNDMYQQSMSIGVMIEDFHKMLIGEEDTQMTYLHHID